MIEKNSRCPSSISYGRFFTLISFIFHFQFTFYNTIFVLYMRLLTRDILETVKNLALMRFQRSQFLWFFATNNARRHSLSDRKNRKIGLTRCRRILMGSSNTTVHYTFNWTLCRINSCILCISGRTWCQDG